MEFTYVVPIAVAVVIVLLFILILLLFRRVVATNEVHIVQTSKSTTFTAKTRQVVTATTNFQAGYRSLV